MEIEGSLLVVGLCLVSAITQEPNKNPTAFLERLKEALQKFTNLYLDSYEGQVILKDKFLSQCASDIRIKLQQLQQQDPAASLGEMVQTATNTFYNREQEREARAGFRGLQICAITQGLRGTLHWCNAMLSSPSKFS